MAFTLDNKPVEFHIAEFEKEVKAAGGWQFRWASSSMGPLRDMLNRNRPGWEIAEKLEFLPLDKFAKYKKAIKYVVYYYADIVPPTHVVDCSNPQKQLRGLVAPCWGVNDFQKALAFNLLKRQLTMPLRPVEDPGVGDLVYGLFAARVGSKYKSNAMICDWFNNALEIDGPAFPKYDQDVRRPDDLAREVEANVDEASGKSATVEEQHLANITSNPNAEIARLHLQRAAVQAHWKQLQGTRYSPHAVFLAPKNNLLKNKEQANAAYLTQYMRLAIRRACKFGVARAASDPASRQGGCQVFFILDMMGDLGKVAFKKPLSEGDPLVPITTSELTFCFRYWDKLQDVVRFFVDGDEVIPPWWGNWRKNGLFNSRGGSVEVFSNQEAWLRYGFWLKLKRKAGMAKEFPESTRPRSNAIA